MRKNITPEILEQRIRALLALRGQDIDPNQPNLRFCGELESCGENTACLRYHTQPWMANPNRVLHGGITAAILDTSMGTLCSVLYEGGFTPTITMNISYALPVPLDADILVRVRASYTGGTTAQLSAELCLPEAPDTVLASATGVYHTARANEIKIADLLSK